MMAGRTDRAKRLRAILVKVIRDETGVQVPDHEGASVSPVSILAIRLAETPGMPWSKLRDLYKEFGLEW